MQHKLLAAAAAATAGLVLTASGEASAQARRAPVPASSAAPSGSAGAPAREAAYGQTAGQGRVDTPSTTESQPASAGFGRPNPGRPEFEDADYRGGEGATGAPPVQAFNNRGNDDGRGQGEQAQADNGQANGGQANGGQANGGQANGGQDGQNNAGTNQAATGGEADALQVADGFFFDNYTSGSGFGVYGGEAVTSGSGEQSNPRQDPPSAGVVFRNLGILP